MGVWSLTAAYENRVSAPSYVTGGLVMHVDAGNTSSYPGSGTTWTDLSGNVSAGSVGSTTYSASNGGYLTFNGSSSIATFPNSTALNNPAFTMEVWVKPANVNQSGFWFEKGSVNTQYSFFLYGGYVYFRMSTTAGLADLTVDVTTAGLSTSGWQQMVATYNSSVGQRLYRNASQVGSNASSFTVNTNAGGMSIGAYGGLGGGGTSYYYSGDLAICRIYSRALTLTEIQQNYNGQKSRFGL